MDRLITERLTQEERELFLRIYDFSEVPTVEAVFPGFNRNTDTERLKKLRAIRGVNFIRPLEGGNWEAAKRVEVTTLGKLVVRYMMDLLRQGKQPSPDQAPESLP